MDMVMLDIMYAPNDKLTLMVMPHWMRHEMTMVGIDPVNTGMVMDHGGGPTDHGHNHAGLPFGGTMTHGTEGFGDTLVSASYRLANTRDFKAHATLGVWLPTGKVDRAGLLAVVTGRDAVRLVRAEPRPPHTAAHCSRISRSPSRSKDTR